LPVDFSAVAATPPVPIGTIKTVAVWFCLACPYASYLGSPTHHREAVMFNVWLRGGL